MIKKPLTSMHGPITANADANTFKVLARKVGHCTKLKFAAKMC